MFIIFICCFGGKCSPFCKWFRFFFIIYSRLCMMRLSPFYPFTNKQEIIEADKDTGERWRYAILGKFLQLRSWQKGRFRRKMLLKRWTLLFTSVVLLNLGGIWKSFVDYAICDDFVLKPSFMVYSSREGCRKRWLMLLVVCNNNRMKNVTPRASS